MKNPHAFAAAYRECMRAAKRDGVTASGEWLARRMRSRHGFVQDPQTGRWRLLPEWQNR